MVDICIEGWVWSFSSNTCDTVETGDTVDTGGHGTRLVSGSWDNSVKFWTVSQSAITETRRPVNLKVAVLSTDMRSNTVVAGTYDKRVVIMDDR